jgi:hypothetical protein
MLKPRPDNPKGFWEHRGITEINDRVLAQFGGSYFDPPHFPVGWEKLPELEELRDHARRVVAEDFGKSPNWCWKDPRTCLTLPFWQQLLPRMQYIICIRNPTDVAHSLHRRDGLPFSRSSNLWVQHVNAAFSATREQRRLVLFYEDMMEDWQKYLYPLAEFVNGSAGPPSDDIREQAEAFVDKELRHHSTTLPESLSQASVSFEAKALYLFLRLRAMGLERDGTEGVFSEELFEPLVDQAAAAVERSQRLQAMCEQLKVDGQRLGAQYQQLAAQLEGLEAHRQKVERQLASEQGRVHELKVIRDQLQEQLAQNLAQLSALGSELEKVRANAERFAGQRDAALVSAQQSASERDAALAVLNDLRRQLADIESSVAWKAVSRARATKDFLVPRGTQRRHLYDWGLALLKNGLHRE